MLFPFITLDCFECRPQVHEKGGAACVSCRGDWYAQGDHARDAAKHATAADDEGYNPPRYSAAETLWYSCPVLCIPLSNDYQSSDRIRWVLYHTPLEAYKPPYTYTHGGPKV